MVLIDLKLEVDPVRRSRRRIFLPVLLLVLMVAAGFWVKQLNLFSTVTAPRVASVEERETLLELLDRIDRNWPEARTNVINVRKSIESEADALVVRSASKHGVVEVQDHSVILSKHFFELDSFSQESSLLQAIEGNHIVKITPSNPSNFVGD